ncbi:gastric mucin [Fusarium albosuccineum]|uniref:Gastric mucin n=1 Tax=Fusarium albosuccineum TaxID=1237068 RepID=A0A8H4PG59_9HYPO|nr:gastric mucin [Fusarium albosuccineum]
MATEKQLLGNVVAFEGHVDTISTQLRLLPTSPQFLILPSIQSYLSNEDVGDVFDARTYVKRIHKAVVTRHEAAQAFLQGSTANSKRLVFMNGGSPGAQALCIKTIMEQETNGDYNRAESIFNQLVKDGVAGLENPARDWRRRSTFEYFGEQEFGMELEDPITRAMRAADALDRQTASLQPTNELDLTTAARPRSNSLPLYGYADNFGDAAPFFVFGAHDKEEVGSVFDDDDDEVYSPRASIFAVTHYDKPADPIYPGFANLQPPSPKTTFPRSPSCIGESYGHMTIPSPLGPEVFTPRSDGFSIRSTDNVVYGEASLLDMRLSGRRATLTRVKSLDRIYPTTPKYRDLCVPPGSTELARESDRDLEQATPSEARRHSCMVITSAKDCRPSRLSYIDGPRTIVVRSNRPTVKVAPVPSEKKRKPARASYVDRGTDAELIPEPAEPFKPVLPFLEDLVVHFKDEVPDALLDSAMRGFRTGNYPIVVYSASTSEVDEASASVPGTPESQSVRDLDCVDEDYEDPTVVPRSSYTDEYDPFAYVQPTWPQTKPLRNVPKLRVERPPTPAQTPPPPTSELDNKFHEFKINSQQTAVAIQNSLRSILKDHFPPKTQGYRQFQFPLLPELEGLWRPIFREVDTDGTRDTSRRMDQILAVGAQRGVRKDYSSAITGQLEKLGTKSSGMSRSGRLDFRYLLANAMQAYTTQPLTSQTHDNPFANSYLLATLIIPHLETYLALHTEVRYLLLEYPPEHLPTMLALQKLVGVDMMKVAQIVDANSKEMLPFTHLRGTTLTNGPEQGSAGRFGAALSSTSGPCYEVTVSKANFLLTSTASDTEIATFISTVLRILSDISSFYIPEEPPKKPSPKKSKPPSLTGTFSPFPRVSSGPQSPPISPAVTARLGTGHPAPSVMSTRTPSIAETVKTAKSVKSKLSRARSRQKPSAADAQSILTMYVDDSDWDQEDRRIMPILSKKPEVGKGNSRKALKFLGLA